MRKTLKLLLPMLAVVALIVCAFTCTAIFASASTPEPDCGFTSDKVKWDGELGYFTVDYSGEMFSPCMKTGTGKFDLKLDNDGDGVYTDTPDPNSGDFRYAGTYRFAFFNEGEDTVVASATLVINKIATPGESYSTPTATTIPAEYLTKVYDGIELTPEYFAQTFSEYYTYDRSKGVFAKFTLNKASACNVGTYTVTVSFEHANYEFDTEFTFDYVITPQKVDKPVVDLTQTFVYSGDAQTFVIPRDARYIVNGDAQTNAGEYTATVTLASNNYVWADDSTEQLKYTFEIAPCKVKVPTFAADNTVTYDGNAHEFSYTHNQNNYSKYYTVKGSDTVTYENNANVVKFTLTNVKDSHSVVFTLNNPINILNYVWEDESYASISQSFTVNPKNTSIAVSDLFGLTAKDGKYEISFEYDKNAHTVALLDGKELPEGVTAWTIVESNNTVTYVKDSGKKITLHFTTDDNHTALDDVEVVLNVVKRVIEAPAADETVFTYSVNSDGNAEKKTYTLATSDYYTISDNTVQDQAGTYTVTVTLDENCVWSDNTTEARVYDFVINKATYDMSGITFENIITPYDGKEYELAYKGTLPKGVIATYNTDNKLKNAGNITVTVSFEGDSNNYLPIPSMTATLSITPIYVQQPAKPVAVSYDGKEHTYVIDESEYYTVSGQCSAINAGKYVITITLNNEEDAKNYLWDANASADPLTYTFEIKKAQVAIPTNPDPYYVYNGAKQKHPLLSDASLSDIYYTVNGGEQTYAGEYTVIVELNENCVWTDGTTENKTLPFTILKADYDAPCFVASNNAFKYNDKHQYPAISGLQTDVTVEYTFEKLIAGTYVPTTYTITPGKYRITATFVGDEENYNSIAPISFEYEIYLEYTDADFIGTDGANNKLVSIDCSEPVADYLNLVVSDVTGAYKSVTLWSGVKADVLLAYDIAFMGYGVEQTPDGTFIVSLYVPDSILNNDNISVVYVNENGEAVAYKHRVVTDAIVFETDHFSVYAIIEVSPFAVVEASENGHWIYIVAAAFFVCVLLLGLMYFISNKKKPFDKRLIYVLVGALVLIVAIVLFVLFFEVKEEYAPVYRILNTFAISVIVLVVLYFLPKLIKRYRDAHPKAEPTVEEYIDNGKAKFEREPDFETTVAKEPIVEEPTVEEPIVEEPEAPEAAFESPALEEPTVEEPTVEEPTVEEPTVEEPEAPEAAFESPAVEEPAAEEPAAEEAKDETVAFEEPAREVPKKPAKTAEEVESASANQLVVGGEVVEVHYRSSFQSRLIQAEGDIQDYYTIVKNVLLSYKGVKARTSWNCETFNKGRIKCAKVNVKGKTLLVQLNLNPVDFNINKYHFTDMSGKPKFDDAPLMMKIKSERALKYTIELIDEMMKLFEIEQGEIPNVDYHLPYEDTETLAQRGLVKVTLPAGVKLEANSTTTSVDVDEVINKAKEQEEPVAEEAVAEEAVAEEAVVEEAVFVDAIHADELITDTQAEELVNVVEAPKASQGKMVTVNLDLICENFEDDEIVNLATLKQRKLISASAGRVKVLARGTMTKKLDVTANKYSLQAIKMIILAGGKANIIE